MWGPQVFLSVTTHHHFASHIATSAATPQIEGKKEHLLIIANAYQKREINLF
jgi:hypothetical protein